ncbi:ATP-binding protein [Streptomyces naganishii]|nr:ATP-binding protein [Streptomyces naganishii]
MLRSSPPSGGIRLEAEDGSPVVTTVLPREPESVSVARRLVRHTLADWRLPHLIDAAELVVSELSANAVEHARHGSFRVTLRRESGDRVRVAVTDKSTAEPVLWPMNAEAEGGRGLALVAALACQWGTEPLGWGKRVWADLEPDQHEETHLVHSVPMYASRRAQQVYVLIVLTLGVVLTLAVVRGAP